MPPLSDGIAALAQLFGEAERRGDGLTLTAANVGMVATALRWAAEEMDGMRARIRALDVEIAGLEAVGRALGPPFEAARAQREAEEQALLDAIGAGKVVLFPMIRRPAFCDGGHDARA